MLAEAGRRNVMQSFYTADFSTNDRAEREPGFSLEGEFGLLYRSGNANTSSLNGRLVADHELENWSNRYLIESSYTRARSDENSEFTTTAQRFNTSVEIDYKLLDPHERVFVFADYENDRFSGFDYQASIATGWAQIKVKSDTTTFRYSVGPGYNYARNTDETQDDTSGLIFRASAEYIYRWSSGARLRQLLSTAAGSTNTRSRSETSISAKVVDSLAMKFSLVLDHNTSPGDDIAPLDTQTSVNLVYQFF